MLNAITMLKSDHVQVKRLLRQLEQIGDRAVKDRERSPRNAGLRPAVETTADQPARGRRSSGNGESRSLPRNAAVSAAGPPASGRP